MPTTLTSRFPVIMAELEPRVKAGMRVGAEAISAEAKMRVPVDTGDLREAIHVEDVEEGLSVVAGDTDAFYGHIVENGSVNQPPRPFLVPALESQKSNVETAVAAALRGL